MSAFEFDDDDLAGLFDQIPALSGQPREFVDLAGGLTNRNLLVTTPAGRFVARCTGDNAEALGIDREVEHHNSCAAEKAGVGAPVIDYRPDLGVLVIGYIEGRTLARADFARADVLERVAIGCRALHAGPRFVGDFDMFERQRGYLETVLREGFRLPDGYLEQAGKIDSIREALRARPAGTVPCHNDLLAGNFVDDGEKIWLIDYEYSGNNEAAFELGNIWMECRLDLDQLDRLVSSYFGQHSAARLARARLLGIVGQYGWTLWGAIQDAVSPLDFDFWEWALERHELAMAELAGPDLARLLDDVQTAD